MGYACTYGINGKEALTGGWEGLNKKIYACLQNDFWFFCTQISNEIAYIYMQSVSKYFETL